MYSPTPDAPRIHVHVLRVPSELILVTVFQWVVKGALDVDALIGANASAEGGGEDEGVSDEAVKVVDIIDTFRLQEQPAFDKKTFMAYIKKYLKKLTDLVPAERQASFKKDVEAAVKFLLSKLSDLQL